MFTKPELKEIKLMAMAAMKAGNDIIATTKDQKQKEEMNKRINTVIDIYNKC